MFSSQVGVEKKKEKKKTAFGMFMGMHIPGSYDDGYTPPRLHSSHSPKPQHRSSLSTSVIPPIRPLVIV